MILLMAMGGDSDSSARPIIVITVNDMRTFLKWGIGAIAAIAILLGLICWVLPTPIVAFFASRSLGTPVQFQHFKPGWHQISFKGLRMLGSDGKPALTIQSGNMDAGIWSLVAKKDLVINSIVLSDINMHLDFSKGMSLADSNWSMLAQQEAPKTTTSDAKMMIKSLSLEHVNVDIIYPSGSKTTLKPIKSVELKNIASAADAGAQLSNLIVGAILRQTLSLENLLPKLADAALLPVDFAVKEGLEQIPEMAGGLIKGIFGGGSTSNSVPQTTTPQ